MAEVVLTEGHEYDTISVRVGDVITIRLSENAGNAYRWKISSLDSSLIGVNRQDYESTSTAVGSAGTAVFKLDARLPGTTRVVLKKARSWDPPESASEHFVVDVHIAE